MSERVNRIVFTKVDSNSKAELFSKIANQLNILLDSGYNCFVSNLDAKGTSVCIEFCLADPTAKNRDIPQPCWLFLDELEYLGKYQLESILKEAQDTIAGITDELDKEEEEEKATKKKKSKKPDYDA